MGSLTTFRRRPTTQGDVVVTKVTREGAVRGSGDCSNVLATVFLHKSERALVSIASWANTSVSCALDIEWDALGFQTAIMVAQPIPNFQNSTNFSVAAAFPVSPARGWLLWLEPFSPTQLDENKS